VVVLDINNRLLELPRRHLAVEQDVQLAITPALQLRQAKEGRREAHSRGTAPDIPTLACEVPAGRVQHLAGEVDHRDLGDVVRTASDSSGERSQAHRAGLGDDGVRDGTQGSGVDEGDEDAEDGLSVVRSVVLRDRGADAEEHEEGAVRGGTVEEDITAAEVGAEGNGEDGGDELEARVDEAELEGEVCL